MPTITSSPGRAGLVLAAAAALSCCALARAEAASPPPPTDPDPIEGKWYGVAGFPQDRIELGFEIKRNDQGELKVYLYQPVLNFYGLELPGALERKGDDYVLGSYVTSFRLVDGRIEGTYMPLHDPMSLRRTDSLPGEVPVPDFSTGAGPRWQVKLGGQIWAAAAVRDSVAYVGTTGGVFNAVSVKDGSFVWTFNAGRPMHGEPLATDDAVFFVCDNGFLYKLDRATGKETWRYDLGDARTPRILPHQIVYDYDFKSPRPLLADGVIYVGSGDGGFHAVDAATGQRLWRFEAGDRIRTDAITSGAQVVFGSFDHFVYALDRKTGQQVWKADTYAEVDGSPALIDGKIVLGNHGSLVEALDPATGKPVWRRIWWGSAVESTPVGYGGRIYIGASDLRRITCMDPKDGRVVWRTDVYGWAWARPLVTGKIVYIGTGGSEPYQMRHLPAMTALDRATGRILWRWPMPVLPGVLYYGFAAPPVLAGSTVVIGGMDGTLYGFPAE